MDLTTLRSALLITLSILVLFLLFKRFRRSVLQKDVPAINHAELLSLDVQYHPSSLRVVMKMPKGELLHMALLDQGHTPLHTYAGERLPEGVHQMVRELPALIDGSYFFEIRTATQRTVRGFRLQQQ